MLLAYLDARRHQQRTGGYNASAARADSGVVRLNRIAMQFDEAVRERQAIAQSSVGAVQRPGSLDKNIENPEQKLGQRVVGAVTDGKAGFVLATCRRNRHIAAGPAYISARQRQVARLCCPALSSQQCNSYFQEVADLLHTQFHFYFIGRHKTIKSATTTTVYRLPASCPPINKLVH